MSPPSRLSPLPRDPSSFSNPWAARVVHTDFRLKVDFDKHILDCWCAHNAYIIEAGCTELILDTRGLMDVCDVSVNGKAETATTGKSSEALGSSLVVPLPSDKNSGDTVRVEMRWKTSPDAVAVQWLAPEQTVGGQHPYLFTQCQPIHARSFCPCQDTPGAKITYTASVTVPSALTALMSALPVDQRNVPANDDSKLSEEGNIHTRTFYFQQPLPISTYLLALAVGNLESRDLSPISRVWSEPGVVEAAAFEFEDTPKFLEAAEAIAGQYRWGRYDLLVLPSSFPYGGMENPNITFVTPTLLAGDKSMANVVAHEISHSWTGNLVTNQNWSGFFLNEGPTVWLERRILGRLGGEEVFQFHASLGWGTLTDCVKNSLGESHRFTCLVPDLSSGEDPDDAFSSIPYEKGFALMVYLENLVGGPDTFIPFFRKYIQHFADTPLTPDDFRKFYTEYFESRGVETVREVDWDAWFYATGMPPVTLEYDESLPRVAYALAKKWHCGDVMGLGTTGANSGGGDVKPCGNASEADIEGWSTDQIVAFLDRLSELRSMTPLHPTTTRAMASAYPILESSHNSEIRCAWYLLCVKAGDESVLPKVKEFLGEQARMKYIRPLYKALLASPKFKDTAVTTFETCKKKYHPISAKMCAMDLGLSHSKGD